MEENGLIVVENQTEKNKKTIPFASIFLATTFLFLLIDLFVGINSKGAFFIVAQSLEVASILALSIVLIFKKKGVLVTAFCGVVCVSLIVLFIADLFVLDLFRAIAWLGVTLYSFTAFSKFEKFRQKKAVWLSIGITCGVFATFSFPTEFIGLSLIFIMILLPEFELVDFCKGLFVKFKGWFLSENCKTSLIRFIILYILTFGVYQLIWFMTRTRFLNNVKGKKQQIPFVQMLLCCFVPFYTIYWTYRNCQRLDALYKEKGLMLNSEIFGLFMSVVCPMVAFCYMQDKLNYYYDSDNLEKAEVSSENFDESDTRSVLILGLLSIVTFGIYSYIYIFKTTRVLNKVESRTKNTPVKQLLLCLFVPFYYIYWVYRQCQKLDDIYLENNLNANSEIVGLGLGVLSLFIATCYMQDKINQLVVDEDVVEGQQEIQEEAKEEQPEEQQEIQQGKPKKRRSKKTDVDTE